MINEITKTQSSHSLILTGALHHPTGAPGAGALIRAFDRALRTENLLGEARTDVEGRYRIEYTWDTQSKGRAPNIQVRAYDASNALLIESKVYFAAVPNLNVDLILPASAGPGPSEIERLQTRILPVLRRAAIAEADIQDSDIPFILAEIAPGDAIPEARIRLLRDAVRMTAAIDLPLEPAYALLRQGLPSSLDQLCAMDESQIRSAIETATKENLIPSTWRDTIDDVVERIRHAAVTHALAGKLPLRAGLDLELLQLAVGPDDLRRHFASAALRHQGPSFRLWENLRRDPALTNHQAFVAKAEVVHAFAALARNHMPLVRRLVEANRQGVIARLEDLARFDENDWLDFIERNAEDGSVGAPESVQGANETERARKYAAQLAEAVEARFPIDVLRHRLAKSELPGGPTLAHVLSRNPSIDLRTTHLRKYLREHPEALEGIEDRDTTVQRLLGMQRIHRLTGRFQSTESLLRDGVHSAHGLTRMSRASFVERYGEPLGGATRAQVIYERAEQVAATTWAVFMTYSGVVDRVTPQAVGRPPAFSGTGEPIPEWKDLFGDLDLSLCECKDCASIYGPAAYLVDLLSRLDRIILSPRNAARVTTVLDKLYQRRPDIGQIELTCENATTEVPYIDLVIEILEHAVAPDSAVPARSRQTTWKARDLRNNPEHIGRRAKMKAAPSASAGGMVALVPADDGPFHGVDNDAPPKIQPIASHVIWGDKPSTVDAITTLPSSHTGGVTRDDSSMQLELEPSIWADLTSTSSGASSNTAELDAYDILAKAKQPWSLPFDLAWEEARLYLEHLGVPRHELLRTFGKRAANGARTEKNVLAEACERIGLTRTERESIVADDKRDRLAAWRPEVTQSTLETLHVDHVLRASGLEFTALEALLRTRYLRNAADGDLRIEQDADQPEVCAPKRMTLKGVTASVLDRLHRFVRLQRKLGWTTGELDRGIAVLQERRGLGSESRADIDDAVLRKMGQIEELRAELDLPLEQLFTFVGRINTRPAAEREESQYDRLFRSRSVVQPPPGAFVLENGELREGHNLNDVEIRPTVIAGLRVSDEDLDALLTARAAGKKLSLDNLSRLYRFVRLARGLGLSIPELLALVAMTRPKMKPVPIAGHTSLTTVPEHSTLQPERPTSVIEAAGHGDASNLHLEDGGIGDLRVDDGDALFIGPGVLGDSTGTPDIHAAADTPLDHPFTNGDPASVLDFVRRVRRVQASPFSVTELDGLYRPRPSLEEAEAARADALRFLDNLQAGLAKIAEAHAMPAQVTADVLRTKLLAVLDAKDAGRAVAILEKTLAETPERKVEIARLFSFLSVDIAAHLLIGPLVWIAWERAIDEATKQVIEAASSAGVVGRPVVDQHAIRCRVIEQKKAEKRTAALKAVMQALLDHLRAIESERLVKQALSEALGLDGALTEILAGGNVVAEYLTVLGNGLTSVYTSFSQTPTGPSTGPSLGGSVSVEGPVGAVDYAWGLAPPVSGILDKNFIAHFQGRFFAAFREEYTFRVETSATRAIVKVAGQTVFDSADAPTSRPIVLSMDEPLCDLELTLSFRLGDGPVDSTDPTVTGAFAKLFVQSPSLPEAVIPQQRLFSSLDAKLAPLLQRYARHRKAALLIQRFGLTDRELRYLLAHGSDFSGLDLNGLPLAVKDFDSGMFRPWERLADLCALRDRLPRRDRDLIDVFTAATPHLGKLVIRSDAEVFSEILDVVAAATAWDREELGELVNRFGLAPNQFDNEIWLVVLDRCFAMRKRLGVNMQTLCRWAAHAPTREDAAAVKQAAKAKHEEAEWEVVAKPLRDALREKQRTALVDYLLQKRNAVGEPRWKNTKEMFDHFLVDVEMSACQMTARIKMACGSVQLFIQRCLMQLEPSVTLTEGDAEELALHWEWMKAYRLWEANRKVFLYPENWIEPELRDDKTPFFKELEEELLQGEITKERVEDVFRHYLEKLDEVARLEVCGFYDDSATGTLHVFGRTTTGTPRRLFYRRRENIGETTIWTAWERVDLDIAADQLMPVVWNGHLYLFWPEFEEKSRPEPIPVPSGAERESHNESRNSPWKSLTIRMAWSEYRLSGWLPRKVFSESMSSEDIVEPWQILCYSDSVKANRKQYDELQSRLAELRNKEYELSEALKTGLYYDGASADPAAEAKWNADTNRDLEQCREEISYIERRLPEIDTQGIYEKWALDSSSDPAKYTFKCCATTNGVVIDVVTDLCEYYRYVRESYPPPKEYWYSALRLGARQEILAWKVDVSSDMTARCIPQDNAWNNYFTASRPKGFLYFGNTLFGVFQVNLPVCIHDVNTLEIQYATAMSLPVEDLPCVIIPPHQSSDLGGRIPCFYRIHGEKTFCATPKYTTALIRWNFQVHYHPYAKNFLGQLNIAGVDGLLTRAVQYRPSDELPGAVEPFNFRERFSPERRWLYGNDPCEDVEFDCSGAYSQYNWEIFFHIPLLIASRFSQEQRFDDAMRWFHYIFNPLDRSEDRDTPARYWQFLEFSKSNDALIEEMQILASSSGSDKQCALAGLVDQWRNDPFKPHLIARTRHAAYKKTVVMKYIDNLIAWGDQLFRRDTIESINEATLYYILAAELLGDRPLTIPRQRKPHAHAYDDLRSQWDAFGNALVEVETLVGTSDIAGALGGSDSGLAVDRPHSGGSNIELASPERVRARGPRENVKVALDPMALYFCIPQNPHLLAYWDTVADRLFKIRHCLNIEGVARKLPLYEPPIDPALLVKAAAGGVDLGSVMDDLSAPLPHYRFAFMLQKAIEFCSEVKALGGQLLATLEKKDAEELSLLRAGQEVKVLTSVCAVKREQVKEAQAAWDGVVASRCVVDQRKSLYDALITGGEIAEETNQLSALVAAAASQAAEQEAALSAAGWQKYPDGNAGASYSWSFGGTAPGSSNSFSLSAGSSFGGTYLAQWARHIAAGHAADASREQHNASQSAIRATFARRKEEWNIQVTLASKEIEQIDKQIAAAEIRKSIADKELTNHELQIENAKEVETFLRDKFTNKDLYNWMVSQISALYFQSYKLAYDIARRAERALQFELGTDEKFLDFGYWDSLKKGLLAGEKLGHDLRRMEAAYMARNARELEITKHVSLSRVDAVQLVMLRETGQCFVNLPETLFDHDYPGHFMRRIKAASLSVLCVSGPYTSINCTLTLVSHSVRRNAELPGGKYVRAADDAGVPMDDPRFVDRIGAVQSIVTSTGQNDAGLFETNLRDERYLPFEGAGAISTWRIELPKDTNGFDFRTLSDIVLHLRFTAREGGEVLRNAARAALKLAAPEPALPAPRLEYPVQPFSAKQDFSAAYYRFTHPAPDATNQTLELDLSDARFPYHHPAQLIRIVRIHVLFRPKPGLRNVDLGGVEVSVGGEPKRLADLLGGLPYANFEVNASLNEHQKPLMLEVAETTLPGSIKPGPDNLRRLDAQVLDDILILCEYTLG